MSVIKPSIKTLMQELLNKPFSLLTDNEKNQLLKNGLITQEKLDRFLKESLLTNREILNRNDKGENNQNKKDSNLGSFSLTAYQAPQDQAQKSSTDNKGADQAAKEAAKLDTGTIKKEQASKVDNNDNENIELMEIDKEFFEKGFMPGMHSGDPLGSTTPGEDKKDYGADSFLAWAKQNAKSSEDISLADRLELISQGPKGERDKLDHYTDGQGIAQLGSCSGTGLLVRDWFELMRMQGDQFIGLARANGNLSDQEARNQARSLLIDRIQEYTKAGITDGNLIGVLIGKGMTAQQFKDSPEEQARYERYNKAKNGDYGWYSMEVDLKSKNIDTAFVERFTGIDHNNANLFTENLYYESYANIDKLSKDLHYFKDKALGFNLIFACDSSRDHNGALHMNHGSITGLAASDKNPTIVMSPRNDTDMMRMIFRLSFIPKDTSISGKEWLGRELNPEEQNLMKMLADKSLSSEEKIKRFNDYLDSHGLEKNVGVANYMLKGHGWGGGIALFDQGNYDNGDKDIMALMGLSISANVDQARIHQQSCSTAVGGEKSNIGVGNDTINDFAPSTTKVVSVGANAIHWNGQGEHYQNVSWIHGNMVNEGQITEKQYYARMGLNDNIRQEEKDALSMWTRNEDGITVRKPKETQTDSNN